MKDVLHPLWEEYQEKMRMELRRRYDNRAAFAFAMAFTPLLVSLERSAFYASAVAFLIGCRYLYKKFGVR